MIDYKLTSSILNAENLVIRKDRKYTSIHIYFENISSYLEDKKLIDDIINVYNKHLSEQLKK